MATSTHAPPQRRPPLLAATACQKHTTLAIAPHRQQCAAVNVRAQLSTACGSVDTAKEPAPLYSVRLPVQTLHTKGITSSSAARLLNGPRASSVYPSPLNMA